MSSAQAAMAALVIVAFYAFTALVFYRAGRDSARCCYRHWGHDAPRYPFPKLPGMQLKPRNEANGPEIIFRSKALD